jgi:hypothetical protein
MLVLISFLIVKALPTSPVTVITRLSGSAMWKICNVLELWGSCFLVSCSTRIGNRVTTRSRQHERMSGNKYGGIQKILRGLAAPGLLHFAWLCSLTFRVTNQRQSKTRQRSASYLPTEGSFSLPAGAEECVSR